jgi:signal transduction histidine kinase
MERPAPRFDKYRIIALLLASYAMLGGLVVMIGWQWKLPALTDWSGTGIAMKFNTGLATLLGAAAMFILHWRPNARLIPRILAAALTLVGGLTLLEHITHFNFRIDNLLFVEPPGAAATVAPGRMGPPAASCFLMLGIGLILATLAHRQRRIASSLGVVIACVVGISLTGYLLGADPLFTIARLTAIAAQTSTLILALALGLIMLVPESGVYSILRSDDAGGMLARRMILPLIGLPLALGYLRVWGQEAGLYDAAFGTAIFAFTMTACLAVIMFKTAVRLGAAEEALRQADRRKDDFLATLAHELRNPLAPIRHSLEIMKRAGDNPQLIEESRATMQRQLSHMVRLIDDLLDVSRITQDRLLLHRESVELAAVLRQAVETSKSAFDCASHQLIVRIPEPPIYLDADPVRLVQVFANLLNNACKYTPAGGQIQLAASLRNNEARVTVTDNGIGIPPDMLLKIFDMFTQVPQHQASSQTGLGIGLSLAKRLVELHGGAITALSEGPGKGSEFTVRLPVTAAAPETPAPQESRPPTHPRKILVVDDNRDAARSLARLLTLDGHDAQLAHDGIEGIAKAADYQPDIMLLDIGMPLMDGYDACRKIRQTPWGGHIKIIALTGWGQQEDRRKTKDAGFDEHLVKPIDLQTLRTLICNQKQNP